MSMWAQIYLDLADVMAIMVDHGAIESEHDFSEGACVLADFAWERLTDDERRHFNQGAWRFAAMEKKSGKKIDVRIFEPDPPED